MARTKSSGTNIWSNSFKSGGEIEGTNVKNGVQSKMILSSVNTSGKSTIAFSITAAIVALAQKRCSIADLGGALLCECKSGHKPGRKYVITYFPQSSKVEAFVVENNQQLSIELSNDHFAHWSLFVPRIANVIINEPNGELAKSYCKILDEMKSAGVISSNNDLLIMNDYLYETRFEYIQDNSEVNMINPLKYSIGKDLTNVLTGTDGDFEFGNLPNNSTANTSKTAQTKKSKSSNPSGNNNFQLDWSSPLSQKELDLIPKFDLGLMKITPEVKAIIEEIYYEHSAYEPVNNIILYGEAGSGKSTAARIMAQILGLPYRSTNLSLNSEESDLVGTYRPTDKGGFEFYEPAFAQAFKYGGVFEGMEPNYARPGALGCLNSALDDNAVITLGNGEIVKRHPNCIIVFTTNVDYAGCQKLNQALKDRFQEMVFVDKLSNDDLIDVAMKKSGNNDRKLIAKLVDAVQKISTKMVEEQITSGVCSTRQLGNWARKCKYVKDPIVAARTTILPGVSLEYEVQKEIEDTILKPLF